MTFPDVSVPKSVYELCWNNAQDATIAVESSSGLMIDANPAAEAMMGYSRPELVGMPVTMIHPEAERPQVRAEFHETLRHAFSHTGFHIQRKDGSSVPVAIWSSQSLESGGRSVVIAEFRDITNLQGHEHRLSTKRWALSAYAGAASAMWEKHLSESFLEAICQAITRESVYALV